jgi:RimJ/RimL family protein N-acetyltransferase
MNAVVRTPADIEGWMRAALELEAAGNGMPWVTLLKDSGRVVGSTRFIDLDRRHQTVEIGNTWLSPEVQGAGVNPECKLLQLRFGFEELGLRRIAFKTHHENLQSQAAIRKLGAVEEGTFRNHYVMPDGSQRHSVWFSITREEWPAVRSRLEERVLGDQRSA